MEGVPEPDLPNFRVLSVNAEVAATCLARMSNDAVELGRTELQVFQELAKIENLDLARMVQMLQTIQTDTGTIKKDVGTIKGDITTIKAEVAAMKGEIGLVHKEGAARHTNVCALIRHQLYTKKDVPLVVMRSVDVSDVLGLNQPVAHFPVTGGDISTLDGAMCRSILKSLGHPVTNARNVSTLREMVTCAIGLPGIYYIPK